MPSTLGERPLVLLYAKPLEPITVDVDNVRTGEW